MDASTSTATAPALSTVPVMAVRWALIIGTISST